MEEIARQGELVAQSIQLQLKVQPIRAAEVALAAVVHVSSTLEQLK